MLRVLGFNGSPRTHWNTAMMVKKALEGASSQGARTEYVDLVNVDFKPCQSCLICKRGPQWEGKCYQQDGLIPILDKIRECDGFVIGTPIYVGLPSGVAHAFLERLLFSFAAYRQSMSVFPRKIKTGFIVTAGAPQDMVKTAYTPLFGHLTGMLASIFGSCELAGAYDTQQVDDYAKYDIQICVPAEKYKRRREQFPLDLQEAFELGKRIATK